MAKVMEQFEEAMAKVMEQFQPKNVVIRLSLGLFNMSIGFTGLLNVHISLGFIPWWFIFLFLLTLWFGTHGVSSSVVQLMIKGGKL